MIFPRCWRPDHDRSVDFAAGQMAFFAVHSASSGLQNLNFAFQSPPHRAALVDCPTKRRPQHSGTTPKFRHAQVILGGEDHGPFGGPAPAGRPDTPSIKNSNAIPPTRRAQNPPKDHQQPPEIPDTYRANRISPCHRGWRRRKIRYRQPASRYMPALNTPTETWFGHFVLRAPQCTAIPSKTLP